jgi:hypothetical protein
MGRARLKPGHNHLAQSDFSLRGVITPLQRQFISLSLALPDAI